MKIKRRAIPESIFVNFSDVSLNMLATIIFLSVVLIMTSRVSQEFELPRLKAEITDLKNKLADAELQRARFVKDLEEMAVSAEGGSVMDKVLQNATFGRKDFDVFVRGLQELPGKDLHLVIDASGSMHGLTSFLIPVLRVIVVRSKKELSAITWYSDNESQTYTGTMGEMFDRLMTGAPFAGNMESIGKAFRVASRKAPAPGAYLLVGDEPGDDTIYFSEIPSPVFTLPLGQSDPRTLESYQNIADKTRGKMLHLDFR